IYALAVRAANPGKRVRASYWYTRAESGSGIVGFDLDDAAVRIEAVLGTILEGIARGLFPAFPGDEDQFHGRPTSCRYCEYDRLCPRDRVRRWARRAGDPALAPFLDLARKAS